MTDIYEFLRKIWYVQHSLNRVNLLLCKYACSKFLENPTSNVAEMFNTSGGIFGVVFKKIDLLAIIFILLVHTTTKILFRKLVR